MGRIKLELKPEFHHKTEIRIALAQLNYGNHLGNEQILVMAHEARQRFFNSLGCSEMNLFGTSVIQSDAVVLYLSEGHYAEDIDIYLAIEEMSRVAFEVHYLFFNRSTAKELARARIGLVCFNYDIKKVQELPALFKQTIDKLPRFPIS